jgi:hypothetical protein
MCIDISILSQSSNGKVLLCNKCLDRVVVMYNNITQGFLICDFLRLKGTVDQLDEEDYFRRYPLEHRLHIPTDFKELFFSFSKKELREFRKLLADGWFKMGLLKSIGENRN